jgi:hypothetical protein
MGVASGSGPLRQHGGPDQSVWLLLERFVLAALCLATLAATLLAARNGLLPVQRPLTHGLLFWIWFLALYLPLAFLLGLGAAALGRVQRLRWLPRLLLMFGSVGLLLAVIVSNRRAMGDLGTLSSPERYRWLLPVAFTLAVLGLLLVGLLPLRRRWSPRLLSLATVAACLLALMPSRAITPSPSLDGAGPVRMKGERFLLFGLDGADWRYLEPLIARGDLPNLAGLREKGVSGPLATLKPTLSPAIWTTVVTGQPPSVHRIRGFTQRRIRGADDALGRLRPVRGVGFERLLRWLEGNGEIYISPVSSLARKVPALWELTTAGSSPLDVVNWWATWPAEGILGRMVTERFHYWRFAARGWGSEQHRVTFPGPLHGELAGMITSPDQVTYADARRFMNVTAEEYEALRKAPFSKHWIGSEFGYFHSMFETNRRVALHLMETGRRTYSRPPDMLLLERLVDMACHTSLRESELVEDHLDATEEEIRRYGGVVSEAYRAADRLLGELIVAFGEGNVIVVSDHGFRLAYHWPDWTASYDHDNAPDGVFLAAGPAFGRGRVEGLSIYEMLPLLAYLKDLPIAQDLPGRLPEEVLAAEFRASHPPRRVASYGARAGGAGAGRVAPLEREMLRRLEALGYLE